MTIKGILTEYFIQAKADKAVQAKAKEARMRAETHNDTFPDDTWNVGACEARVYARAAAELAEVDARTADVLRASGSYPEGLAYSWIDRTEDGPVPVDEVVGDGERVLYRKARSLALRAYACSLATAGTEKPDAPVFKVSNLGPEASKTEAFQTDGGGILWRKLDAAMRAAVKAWPCMAVRGQYMVLAEAAAPERTKGSKADGKPAKGPRPCLLPLD